ncbi:hypothetical protein RUM43_013167, partial [Polyplax serrata]
QYVHKEREPEAGRVLFRLSIRPKRVDLLQKAIKERSISQRKREKKDSVVDSLKNKDLRDVAAAAAGATTETRGVKVLINYK